MNNNVLITTQALTKIYRDNPVVNQLNFNLYDNELASIIGASGTGKSTLLNLLIGDIKPTSGDVILFGRSLSKIKDKDLSNLKLKNIGFINQHAHLLKELNVIENIILPARLDGSYNKQSLDLAYQYLDFLNILPLANININELSGGEKQRVSIARSLIMKPKLIVADEPTGNLDKDNANAFLKLLRELHDFYKTSMLIVTHDDKVADYCTSHYQLSNGVLSKI